MTVLTYKGYTGKVEVDLEENILYGEVIDIRDVVTFQGESIPELTKAFHDSVDDYLEFCEEEGVEPDKAFSGKFVVRLAPDQHRLVSTAAAAAGISLNAWVSEHLLKDAQQDLEDRGISKARILEKS